MANTDGKRRAKKKRSMKTSGQPIQVPSKKTHAPDLTVIRIELTRASFFVNLLDGVSEDYGTDKWTRTIVLSVIDNAVVAIERAIKDVDKLLAQREK
jgi:hypothetical protein